MRRLDRAALATRFGETPYASLVLVAFDLAARPLLLLSDLAQHTRNLAADPAVSLLFDGTAGFADPLAGPRLTLLGRAEPAEEPALRARFVRRHPSAAAYAGFADFRLYRVEMARAHRVAGFGRIDWIDGGELRFAGDTGRLAAAEDSILAHMNADHADALARLAGQLPGAEAGAAAEPWRMTGIDPDGIDLRRGGAITRFDFAEPVLNAAAARRALVALVRAPPPGAAVEFGN